jgi:hypothetical protein
MIQSVIGNGAGDFDLMAARQKSYSSLNGPLELPNVVIQSLPLSLGGKRGI